MSNSIIAAGHDNGSVTLWNYNNKQLIREIKHSNNKVRTLSFSVDGKYLAIGGSDSYIYIYETENYELVHKLKHDNQVVSLRWHLEVPILVSTSADNLAILWTEDD